MNLDYTLLSDEDLIKIIERSSKELQRRKDKLNKQLQLAKQHERSSGKYTHFFCATNTYGYKPYAARIFSKGGKFEREFFELFQSSNSSQKTISGNLHFAEGDILELREEITRYFIAHEGQLVELCYKKETVKTAMIYAFLEDIISLEELFQYCIEDKEIIEVIDDLKD
ncbi:hypothetical protein IW492_02595 [Enterococcus sp. BWB1-3]|uniref:hypothetical protein n=1 Tax=Enterococcus sp. BWB1-3 TaxID=2787713 RepID=UPI0019219F30|nr:hypothetical protein [Enterococcus sp. BWB1-3]MBL1228120.1 hypothetical protein [Enterococcus sp. BWB1-3]